jgi:hypothetical protein
MHQPNVIQSLLKNVGCISRKHHVQKNRARKHNVSMDKIRFAKLEKEVTYNLFVIKVINLTSLRKKCMDRKFSYLFYI